MNANAAEYIWRFIAIHAIGNDYKKADSLDERFLSEIDLPCDIMDKIIRYFISKDRDQAIHIAIIVAREYLLASFKPNEHIFLTAYLLREGKIDSEEACMLVQVDHSNFGLMNNDARNIVMSAECITEEKRLALFDTDSDQLLGDELVQYIKNHGKNLLEQATIQPS